MQRFWEPTLIVGIGVLLLPASTIFAGFIFVQGMALAISENGMYQINRNTLLDMIDAEITARRLRYTMGALEQREGFDPDYDDTPYGKKIRDLIKNNYNLYAQVKSEREQQKKDVLSKKWRLELYGWEGPPSPPIKYEKSEKTLKLGPNPSDYGDKDDVGLYVWIGDGSWIDVPLYGQIRQEGR